MTTTNLLDRAREHDELIRIARLIEDLKRPCNMDDPESAQAIRNGQYQSIALLVRALASRLADLDRARSEPQNEVVTACAAWHRKMNLELSGKGSEWASKQMYECPHGKFATALEAIHTHTLAARDAEIAELKKSVEFLAIDGTQRINDAEDIAERAEAQVAELRKDAERYRWLKDNICPIFMLKRKPIYGVSAYIYSVKMDAQIDAAMEESKR